MKDAYTSRGTCDSAAVITRGEDAFLRFFSQKELFDHY